MRRIAGFATVLRHCDVRLRRCFGDHRESNAMPAEFYSVEWSAETFLRKPQSENRLQFWNQSTTHTAIFQQWTWKQKPVWRASSVPILQSNVWRKPTIGNRSSIHVGTSPTANDSTPKGRRCV
ncbi:unnamed protein product [Bursaphelenchus xylophilus]|uniref:(pine wood nematode) hypothetical protein n=1 Tax=Bursaphelenchus xylophilus TaxID=6326 RepID=A0A811LTL6_BURXY|nr:unnamed protein product [Bursaphelenchus xylophilus]CAG9126577.1 unnamed protein product [Bursaphelenchus xylophilus]